MKARKIAEILRVDKKEVNSILYKKHEKEEEKKTAKSRNADMHIPACVYCSARPFDTDTVYPVYGK